MTDEQSYRQSGAHGDEDRYTTLDGMRGLAALAVALYHWGLSVEQIAPAGYLAVDFFFGLSGFVIALNYSDRLAATLSTREFVLVRLIRFYPIYLFGHLLGLLRSLMLLVLGNPNARGGSELILAAIFGTFMLPVPIEARNLFPLNVPAWTLFLELLINIAFALGMFRLTDRVLLVLMTASAAVLTIYTGPPHFMDVGYSAATFLLGVARVCFSFPLGIILFRRLGASQRTESWLALLPICLLVATLVWTPPIAHRGTWELWCIFGLFPAILTAGIRLELPRLISRPFAFLGGISYAVYAIHGPLIIFINKIAERLVLNHWLAIALYLAVLIAAAQAVVVLFDRPIRGAVNSWRRQPRAAAG